MKSGPTEEAPAEDIDVAQQLAKLLGRWETNLSKTLGEFEIQVQAIVSICGELGLSPSSREALETFASSMLNVEIDEATRDALATEVEMAQSILLNRAIISMTTLLSAAVEQLRGLRNLKRVHDGELGLAHSEQEARVLTLLAGVRELEISIQGLEPHVSGADSANQGTRSERKYWKNRKSGGRRSLESMEAALTKKQRRLSQLGDADFLEEDDSVEAYVDELIVRIVELSEYMIHKALTTEPEPELVASSVSFIREVAKQRAASASYIEQTSWGSKQEIVEGLEIITPAITDLMAINGFDTEILKALMLTVVFDRDMGLNPDYVSQALPLILEFYSGPSIDSMEGDRELLVRQHVELARKGRFKKRILTTDERNAARIMAIIINCHGKEAEQTL